MRAKVHKIIIRKQNGRKKVNNGNKEMRRADKQLTKLLGEDIQKKYKVNSLDEFEQKYKVIPKNNN